MTREGANPVISGAQACYNTGMHIRFYTTEDGTQTLYDFCWQVMSASYGRAYSAAAFEMFREYHTLDSLRRDVAGGHVFGAWDGPRLVGTVTVTDGELGRMFVAPQHQGTGIGRRLMEAALARCDQLGWPKITAWAVPWARQFYHHFGFVCVNADVLDFHNTRRVPVPYFEMERRPVLSAAGIAPVEPRDVEELLEGQRSAFSREAQRYGDWRMPPLVETVEQARRQLAQGVVMFKAVGVGGILGAVRGSLQGDTGHIGRLFVLPAAQRGGLARALMARVEEALAQAQHYELFTGEHSQENLALYQRQGYAPSGRSEPVDVPGAASYRMVWLQKPGPWRQIEQCIGRYRDGK